MLRIFFPRQRTWPTCYWLDPVANADPSSLVKSASVDRPDRATSIRVMAHKPRQIKVR